MQLSYSTTVTHDRWVRDLMDTLDIADAATAIYQMERELEHLSVKQEYN